MKKYRITPDQETNSRFGRPYAKAREWYWAEINLPSRENTGNVGRLRAVTEMEALERLREAYPTIGPIKWIGPDDFNQYPNEADSVREPALLPEKTTSWPWFTSRSGWHEGITLLDLND